MCIIISKPSGAAMPSMETLENCWYANPDGAGIMYAHDGRVHIHKGIMLWEDFTAYMQLLSKHHDVKSLSLTLHFRISTQAGVNPQNTHPFPITQDEHKLVALDAKSTIGAVVHNGIIPCCSTTGTLERYSDTFYFVRDYVAPLIKHSNALQKPWIRRIIKELAQSKLAFMLPNGKQILIGKFIKKGDVYFSNNSFDTSVFDLTRKDTKLYMCLEDYCYFDTDLGDYFPCDPQTHMFDDYGELWYYDEKSKMAYPLYFAVLDSNLSLVTPTEKGVRFASVS